MLFFGVILQPHDVFILRDKSLYIFPLNELGTEPQWEIADFARLMFHVQRPSQMESRIRTFYF
jgi:hypothetical protein